jgi:hypothetical protein
MEQAVAKNLEPRPKLLELRRENLVALAVVLGLKL